MKALSYFKKNIAQVWLFISTKMPIKKNHPNIFKPLFITVFALIGIYIVVVFASFIFYFKGTSSIFTDSLQGKKNVEQAVNLLRQEKFDEALIVNDLASAQFNSALKQLNYLRRTPILGNLPLVSSEFEEMNYLLSAVEILSRALGQGIEFGQGIKGVIEKDKNLSYGELTAIEKQRVLEKIFHSAPELNGMKANFDLALFNLDHLRLNGVLLPFKNKIIELKDTLVFGSRVLNEAVPLSQIIPVIGGFPSGSTFLVLLQNEDELRPTGGFLGTYGILETKNGDIVRFDTHDIYHMDMPVEGRLNVEPPKPIGDYLNKKWYMRDSNWSPDWPTAAAEIENFYHLENNLLVGKNQINNFSGEFAGVLAVSPGFVTKLLEIIGPITINNQTYSPENFTKLLEYKVEKGYVESGTPSWERKEEIGKISQELKKRLLDLPASDWPRVFTALEQALLEKEILLNFKSQLVQNVASEQGWSGEIKKTAGDYLMLVDANMASLKTDAVINRALSYQVLEKDHKLFAKFIVNYQHGSSVVDWRTDRYQSYSRLYVPAGSKLISISGASSQIEETLELGKKAFGFLVKVEPGSEKSIILEYQLPDELSRQTLSGAYSLFIQKQPNSRVKNLSVDLSFANRVKSSNPVTTEESNDAGHVSWLTDLTVDRNFSLNF